MDFYHLTSTTRDFHRKSIEKSFIKGATNLSADFDETWQWVLGHVNLEWEQTFIALAADQSNLATVESEKFGPGWGPTRLSDRVGTLTTLTGWSWRRRGLWKRRTGTSLAVSSFLAPSSAV